MYSSEPSLLGFLAVGAVVVLYARERYREWAEPTEEEALRQAYANGEIGDAEFERRMGYLVDDRNDEIVGWLDRNVENVAETKGKAIAKEFESLNALRQADHEEITDVHGVGDSTADAIQRSFDAEEESVA